MENTKEEEEHYPKLQNGDENYPKLCISPALETPRGIYRHQENRGPGDKPWPEARPRSRPSWGHARGVSSRARSRLSPVRPCARFLVCNPWFSQNQLSVNGYL